MDIKGDIMARDNNAIAEIIAFLICILVMPLIIVGLSLVILRILDFIVSLLTKH